MGPEEQYDGQRLQEEAQGHRELPPCAISEDRDGKACEGADAIHGAHHQGPGGEGQSLGSDNICQIDDENGVAGAPPVVDADEVPEGERAPGLLEKDGGTYPSAGTTLHGLDWGLWIGPQGPQPDL